jgi:hypothetical protein
MNAEKHRSKVGPNMKVGQRDIMILYCQFISDNAIFTFVFFKATSFGIDIPHNDREDFVIESLDKAYAITAKRMSTFYLHPKIIYNLTSYYREEIKNRNHCRDYVKTVCNAG